MSSLDCIGNGGLTSENDTRDLVQRPLHICLVHSLFPPLDGFGGIVRYIVTLARGLQALGHRVSVVCRDDDNPRVDSWEGIETHRIAVPRSVRWLKPVRGAADIIACSAQFRRAIEKIHRQSPVDVVEFTNYAAEPLISALGLSLPKVCRVSTMGWQAREVRNENVPAGKVSMGDRFRDWLEMKAILGCELLISPSNRHAETLRRRFGPNLPLQVIPHGLDPIVAPAPDKSPTRPLQFLFVGKMEPRKGFDTLIEAFSSVHRATNGKVELMVVGNDSNQGPGGSSFLNHVIEPLAPEIRRSIRLEGWVPDDELPKRYADCDIFIAPSRYESFGLIYLEAMQFGKPVIGCDTGGVSEIVRDQVTGILVEPGSAAGLAVAMARMVEDSESRREMGRSGRSEWERRFTAHRMCEASVRAYKELLVR